MSRRCLLALADDSLDLMADNLQSDFGMGLRSKITPGDDQFKPAVSAGNAATPAAAHAFARSSAPVARR